MGVINVGGAHALNNWFRARGVAMKAFAPGIATPLVFSDTAAEHLTTRRACGLFDFSFMACLEIRGRQSLDFLHRIQTRNLVRLARGRIAYTLLLRKDNSVLNDATVWCFGDDHYALFVGRRTDATHVRALAHGFEVTMTDRAGDHAVLAVQGPQAWRTLARCLEQAPTDLPWFGFWSAAFRGRPCWVARLGYSGEAGYEIVAGAEQAPALWEALCNAGATPCGFAAIDSLRMEAGYLLFSTELAQPVTPAALGLSRLVDNYGSEFVGKSARRQTPPASRYTGLLMERLPDGIDPNALIGTYAHARITSACRSPILQRVIALGFVDADHAAPGTRLRLAPGLTATVARLPFYDPARHLARRTR